MNSPMNIFSLQNMVAVVTGGYGHLGKALTEALAGAGATVYVLARHKTAFDDVFKNSPNVKFCIGDILSMPSLKNAMKKIYQREKRLDILVNNAFYMQSGDPETITEADWVAGVDGVLNSVFRCQQSALPYLKISRGNIINIASMYGMVSPDFDVYAGRNRKFLNSPNYGAAKAGVIQLTKYYAAYFAKNGVRVNCISPGAFPAESIQKNHKFIQSLEKRIPLGRIGEPAELQGAVIYLSSPAARYVTGHNLVVDGGWTIK